MTNSFNTTYKSFPVSRPDDLERVLVQSYAETTTIGNAKENGNYELQETICGQQFFTPGSNIKRFVYRKCVLIGAIATGAIVVIPHGINIVTFFTSIRASVVTDFPDWRSIPYAGSAFLDFASIRADTTDIHVWNGAGMPNIVSGFAILEYFKS